MSEKKKVFLPTRVPVGQQRSCSSDEDEDDWGPQKKAKSRYPSSLNKFSIPLSEARQVTQNNSTNCLDTILEDGCGLSTPAYSSVNRLPKSHHQLQGNDSAYASITKFKSGGSKILNRASTLDNSDNKVKKSLLDRYSLPSSTVKPLFKDTQHGVSGHLDFANIFPTPRSKSPTSGCKVLQGSVFHNSRLASPSSCSYSDVNNDYKAQNSSDCHVSPLQSPQYQPWYLSGRNREAVQTHSRPSHSSSPPSVRNNVGVAVNDVYPHGTPSWGNFSLSSHHHTTPKPLLAGEKNSTRTKGAAEEEHRRISPVSWLQGDQKKNCLAKQNKEKSYLPKETVCHKESSVPLHQEKDVKSVKNPPSLKETMSVDAGKENQKPQEQKKVIIVKNVEYTVTSMIGKGGFSKVYEVTCPRGGVFALKVVNSAENEIRTGLMQEIHLLEQFKGCSYIVQMQAWEFRGNVLYVVMEKGETDLAVYMKKEGQLKPNAIKFLWSELLAAVKCIHDKGIIHNDLKPANFLVVGDHVKVIDFGIASKIQNESTSVYMDTPMGTLNYMSPESVQQNEKAGNKLKVNRKADVWSLGCILYNLVYGKTPFQHIRGVTAKILAIVDPKHKIDFGPLSDPLLMEVLTQCLNRNVIYRPSVEDLLAHPYVMQQLSEEALIAIFRQLTPRRKVAISKLARDLVKGS